MKVIDRHYQEKTVNTPAVDHLKINITYRFDNSSNDKYLGNRCPMFYFLDMTFDSTQSSSDLTLRKN